MATFLAQRLSAGAGRSAISLLPMDRRDFLLSVVATSSLAGVQPGQTPRAAGDRRGLKLGTVTYNIAKDWDLPTLVKNQSRPIRCVC